MADIKNFGLTGVGGNVQYSKAGPRIKNNAGNFEIRDAGDSSYVKLSGAAGTGANDFVTLTQLESSATGINVKGSVKVGSTFALVGAGTQATGTTNTSGTTPNITVDSVTMTENGATYFSVPTVTFSASTGASIATGTAVLDDMGRVASISMDTPGAYATADLPVTVTIAAPAGSGAWSGTLVVDPDTDPAVWFDASDNTVGNKGDTPGKDTGQLTGMPNILDGYTLMAGDRVLIKEEGITRDGNGNVIGIDNTLAYQNGVYQVGTVGTGIDGVWRRADDSGGTATIVGSSETTGNLIWRDSNDTVGFGDYVFVSNTEGPTSTTNGKAYLLTNSLNIVGSAGHTEPHLNQAADDEGAQTWALFSASQTYDSSDGIELVGSTFRLDIDSLGTGTVAGASTLAFGDASLGGVDEKTTVTDFLQTLDIPRLIGANGMVAKTADDAYTSRTITADTTALTEGILVTNGDGVSGNPLVGLDIENLTAAGAIQTSDEIVISNGTNNRKVALNTALTDLGAAVGLSSGDTGYVFNDSGTYRTGGLTAAGTGALAGIDVTTTNATGATVIGLDINNLTTTAAALTDTFAVYKAGGTADNREATVQSVIDLVAGAISDNEISQGDSSVIVTDAGLGNVAITVDGGVVGNWTATGLVATSLTGNTLTAGRVLVAGTAGVIEDDEGLTYDTGTNQLLGTGNATFASLNSSVGGISATTTLTAGGNITSSGGDINATSGTITGLNVTATGTGTFASLIDQSLTLANGVTFALGGNFAQDDGLSPVHTPFTYDPSTGTLNVEAINAVNLGLDVTAGLVLYGSVTAGVETSDAEFSYNSITDTLTVGNGSLVGDSTGDTTLTTSKTNGNIVLTPDGTGEVVISGTGDAEISADAASALILRGDDIQLTSVDGNDTYATFGTTGGDANYLDFASVVTTSAPTISATGSDTNIAIELVGKGTGTVIVTSANYETDMIDDSLATKKYVDDTIQSSVVPGSVASVTGVVSLAANATVNIGAVLPANVTILRVYVQVTTVDAAATLSVGNDNGGVADYMATTENDPQTLGKYVADGVLTAGSLGDQVTATVAATNADVGASATVTVEYRYV